MSFLLSLPPLLSFPFYCWCVAFLFSSFPFFCPCFPPSTSNILSSSLKLLLLPSSLISPFHCPSSPFSYLPIFFPPFPFPSLSFYLPFPLSCHKMFYHSLLPFLPNLLFSSLLHLAFFYVLLPASLSLSLPLSPVFLFPLPHLPFVFRFSLSPFIFFCCYPVLFLPSLVFSLILTYFFFPFPFLSLSLSPSTPITSSQSLFLPTFLSSLTSYFSHFPFFSSLQYYFSSLSSCLFHGKI